MKLSATRRSGTLKMLERRRWCLLLGVDLEALVIAIGYAGLFAIIFAETGLLIGFFSPATRC